MNFFKQKSIKSQSYLLDLDKNKAFLKPQKQYQPITKTHLL